MNEKGLAELQKNQNNWNKRNQICLLFEESDIFHKVPKNFLELKIPIGYLMITRGNLLSPRICEIDFFYRDCREIFMLHRNG